MDFPNDKSQCIEYRGEWKLIREDGTTESFQIPGKCKAEKNELTTVETVIPDTIEKNVYFCFRSAKQDMKIYVADALRQEYSTKETRLFGKASAVAFVFVEINPEDAGKTLRVEAQTDSSYSGIFYEVYYGTQIGIWRHYFSQFGIEIIVAFLTIVLAVVVIFANMALRLCLYEKTELEYLGWGVFVAGIWLIMNSMFRQMIFPNISMVNDMAFLMLMLLPLPFLIYVNQIQKGRYEKAHIATGILCIVDIIGCTFLHAAGIVDYTDIITFMIMVCFISVAVMGITMILDAVRGYIKEYRFVAIGVIGACLAAVVQSVMYFNRTVLFTGAILAVGLIVLLLFATIDTIFVIAGLDKDRKKAFSNSESKGRFLANMSHEIRTPINAVLGMDAMILRESTEPEIKGYAMDIQNAGQSLLALINDILDFSKIESGKMEINPAEYDFSSMIHDIVNMISIKAQAKDLEVELSVDNSLPSRLYGDDVRVRQVLVNLLNNAVKYTDEGHISFTVRGERIENKVILEFIVEDTGIGIKPEDLDKLCEEYTRVDANRNRNVEGTGLGMSITTTLLEMMGSKLQIQSVYTKGSTFSFFLEQEIVDEEPIGDLEQRIVAQAQEYKYSVKFTAPSARALVVDDNGINRRVFTALLKETKIQIDEAASGYQCLQMAEDKRYDIIFLDHMMPEMDGIETLQKLREENLLASGEVKVIALTANAISGAREMYLEAGFDDFLSKPINTEKLETMLLNYLPHERVLYVNSENQEKKEKQEAVTLPELEGIDWEYALLHIGDRQNLIQAVQDFYSTIETEAAVLEEQYEKLEQKEVWDGEEALDLYRIKVHSMKSSAAIIGAMPVSGLARALEMAAKTQNEEMIRFVTPEFLRQYRNLKNILAVMIPKEEEEKTEGNLMMLEQYMHLLDAAMEDMDVDTADEIMRQLNGFLYDAAIQEKIQELAEAVANLDLEKVKKHIDEIQNGIKE